MAGDAAVHAFIAVDMAKVTQTYFVLFTFLTIVKWFRDVTDSV
jgi:hypothetical protein